MTTMTRWHAKPMKSPRLVTTEAHLFSILENDAGGWKVIAIDGIDGTGKSSLAKHINKTLHYPHIEFDTFVRHGYGHLPYPAILDLDGLRRSIEVASVLNSTVIVESILLRLVLDALGIDRAFHIYVQRSLPDGVLKHVEMFDDGQTEDELIAKSIEVGRLVEIADHDESPFDRQFIRYHKQRSPHRNADVLYKVCF